MYIAICDDQPEALHYISALIDEWQKERCLPLRYKVFYNAVEMLASARQEHFTLYLLDILMPGINGITTAEEIRSFDDATEIVFITSTTDFAYASYGVRALNYLLKPIGREPLFKLLDKLHLQEQRPQEALMLKTGTTLIRVPFSNLVYVEVIRKHLYFHLINNEVREVMGALKDYENQLLARPEFMRVHRSYIVNMLQAAELSPTSIRTFAGETLPVSRLLYPQLQKDYIMLLFENKEV